MQPVSPVRISRENIRNGNTPPGQPVSQIPAPGKTPLSAKKISGGIRFSGECYFPRADVGNRHGRCPRAGRAFPAGHVIHAACINIPSDIRYGSPALNNEKAIAEKDPA